MYKITVPLLTPIILLHDANLTLDSVLHHLLTDKYGDSDTAIKNMPLEIVGSVFAASSALFDARSAHYCSVSRVSGLKGDKDAGTELFAPNGGTKNKPSWRPFDIVRDGDGVKNTLYRYQAIKADNFFWYFNGDPDEVKEILQGAIGFGKRSSSGHGQFNADKLAIEMIDWDATKLENGSPSRPIPIEEWVGDSSKLRKEIIACTPPYFSSNPKNCVLQSSRFIKA